MNNEEVLDHIAEINPEAMFPTGLEDAIIGITNGIASDGLIVLDHQKCVEIFMERDGMSHEEAIEWMSYNVTGAFMGEHTPIFVDMKENFF